MKTKLMIAVLIGLLMIPTIVFAAAAPGNWWGKVYDAGTTMNLVPDGTLINAYINNKLVATANVGEKLGPGYYELFIEAINGQNITFKIGSVSAASDIFSDGAHPQLDLYLAKAACGDTFCNGAEKCGTCPGDCGVCPVPPDNGGNTGGSGGGSSGGSGGSGSSVSLKAMNSSNSTANESIHAANESGFSGEGNFTLESNPSNENESIDAVSTERKGFLGITGAAIGDLFAKGSVLVGVLVMLAIIGVGFLLFLLFKRRKKKGKKHKW
jgi:hypothetical protein